MKIKEIRSKSDSELRESMLSSRKKLFNIRFQRANGEVANLSQISIVKKDVARIKTILTERANKKV